MVRKIGMMGWIGLLVVMVLAACQAPGAVAPAATQAPAVSTPPMGPAATATGASDQAATDTATPASATATPEATPAATPTAEPAAATATSEPAPPTATAEPTAEPTETPIEPTAAPVVADCSPTPPDALGPFYEPNAPERDTVGEGYVLTGVIRSAEGCAAIPGATVELWMAGPDGVYTDEFRATIIVGADGVYRFQSHFPPPYQGRPSHIHMLVSAEGFEPLVTQHYPEQGDTESTFDVVIVPVGS